MTRVEWVYGQNILNVLTGCLYVSPQGMSAALPPSSDILEAATKLKKDVDGLKTGASVTADKLNAETNKAKAQITEAKNVRISAYIKLFEKLQVNVECMLHFLFFVINQAVMESTGALQNAKNARDAVSDTLTTISDIMSSLGEL